MFAEIMADKKGIAVSGTHGKTTTTSMIASVLDAGGLAPTVLIGGEVNDLGANARLGSGDIVVAEADESDASFLRLRPTCAVVTNIENDHLGYYRDLEHLIETFSAFIDRVPPDGSIVASADCAAVAELLRRFRQAPSLLGDPSIVTAGFDAAADVRAVDPELADFGSSFRRHGEQAAGRDRAARAGPDQCFQCSCAVAVGLGFGVQFDGIAYALGAFPRRGAAVPGSVRERTLMIVDDYAHHPTAVQETIAAARAYWPGRFVVAFQPHRYSRTAYLVRDFARALLRADEIFVAISMRRANCRCRACARSPSSISRRPRSTKERNSSCQTRGRAGVFAAHDQIRRSRADAWRRRHRRRRARTCGGSVCRRRRRRKSLARQSNERRILGSRSGGARI